MFIVPDVSTLLLIMFSCLWSRRCSGAEGCGQSSGAIQTGRHALRSLLPQTQRIQRRDGGAAVRRLGWPGLCWKDLALPCLNTYSITPLHLFKYIRKYTPLSNVCLFLFMYVCVSFHCLWKCFLLPLPVVSPCLALHRLEQCSSHSIYIYSTYPFTHWPRSSVMSHSHFISKS